GTSAGRRSQSITQWLRPLPGQSLPCRLLLPWCKRQTDTRHFYNRPSQGFKDVDSDFHRKKAPITSPDRELISRLEEPRDQRQT
ncbi:hypothetical protein LEMLEM_LOCUS6289, partial [Lemmus lemmus]